MSRTMRAWLLGLVAALLLPAALAASAQARSATPDPDAAVTNGRVRAIAHVDGKTVLGGSFDYVGPQTGSGVPFTTSGTIAARYPQVVGEIRTAVADGAGGVFVGGEFTTVGGLRRDGLAHIRSDGTVDASWDAALGEGARAFSIAVAGSRVWVSVSVWRSGATSGELRVLDASDGSDTGLAPDLGLAGLASDGTTVYASGGFTEVDGAPRNGLAAFDADGDLLSWDPQPDGAIDQLLVANGVLYVTGSFSEVGGAQRAGFAALDLATGAATAFAPPALQGQAFALAATGTTVYAGGSFRFVDGESREHLAAFDATSGALTSWAPSADGLVETLAISGGTLVAGGEFTAIDGNDRSRLAAFDTADGRLNPWHVRAAGAVHTIAPTGGHVYVGGYFSSVGGVARHNIAALDRDGQLLPWSPDPDGDVRALAVTGRTVVAGGDFATFDGQARSRLAAIDADDGALLAWDPVVTGGPVRALTLAGGTLYAGGTFTAVDGARRTWIAAFATSDGSLRPWSAEPSWSGPDRSPIFIPPFYEDPMVLGVYSLDEQAGTLYAGGLFDRVGSATRTRVAAFDADDATLLPWSPSVVGAPIPRRAVRPDAAAGPHRRDPRERRDRLRRRPGGDDQRRRRQLRRARRDDRRQRQPLPDVRGGEPPLRAGPQRHDALRQQRRRPRDRHDDRRVRTVEREPVRHLRRRHGARARRRPARHRRRLRDQRRRADLRLRPLRRLSTSAPVRSRAGARQLSSGTAFSRGSCGRGRSAPAARRARAGAAASACRARACGRPRSGGRRGRRRRSRRPARPGGDPPGNGRTRPSRTPARRCRAARRRHARGMRLETCSSSRTSTSSTRAWRASSFW